MSRVEWAILACVAGIAVTLLVRLWPGKPDAPPPDDSVYDVRCFLPGGVELYQAQTMRGECSMSGLCVWRELDGGTVNVMNVPCIARKAAKQ